MLFKNKRLSTLLLIMILSLSVLLLSGCKKTEEITFEFDSEQNGYWIDTDGKYIGETLEIPAEHEGLPVLGIKDKAFKGAKNLKSLIINDDGSDSNPFVIGVKAFADCKSLESVKILNTDPLTVKQSAFSDCEGLRTVDINGPQVIAFEIYAFEYTEEIKLSIKGADVRFSDSVFFDNENASTVELTDCTGSIVGTFKNAYFTNCSFDNVEIGAKDMLLDNTRLLDDDMYLSVSNATFRGTVVYKNNYKKSVLFGKGGIIYNLTIESIGEGSEFSQITDSEYYPLAEKITFGRKVDHIPAGVFGNVGLDKLYKDDSKKLEVTYQGAQIGFTSIPYDSTNNANRESLNFYFESLNGSPAKLTFVDENGNTVATIDTTISNSFNDAVLDPPNTTLVEGRIINGYYLDPEHTTHWRYGGEINGDTTVYLSFVGDEYLKAAELEIKNDAITDLGDHRLAFSTNKSSPAYLDAIKDCLSVSEYASVECFADPDYKTPAPSVISDVGDHRIYIRITSYDKTVTNIYTLDISIKDIFEIKLYKDGSLWKTESIIEGRDYELPDGPTKNGHTFLGWSVNDSADGIIGEDSILPTGNMRLTAIYKKDVYTVTIAGTDLSYTVEWGDELRLPLSEERDYYAFKGYQFEGQLITDSLDENGCVIGRYTFGKSIELTPMYIPKQYTLRLDNETIYYTVESDDIVLPEGKYEWYKFLGWYTESGGNGDKIEVIDTSSPANITLYGHFELDYFTIRFMDGNTVIEEQTFSYLSMIAPPKVPEKAGYTSSWESYTKRPENIDVKLIRTPIRYTITYENTFDIYNTNVSTYTVEDDIALLGLVREHYSFDGWRDADGNTVSAIASGTVGDIVLTAEWSLAKYPIYFYTTDSTYTLVEIEYGKVFDFSGTEIPNMTNKLFIGWYDKDYTTEFKGLVTISGAVNVYAKWLDSIQLSTYEDFEKIRENPSGTFHLAKDIDMRGSIVEPIAAFSGLLDGKGYKLYNFTLKINSTLGSFALFNENSGTIRDLRLDEVICSVTTSPTGDGDEDNIGILVGVNKGTISGCTVKSPSLTVTASFSHSSIRYYFSIGAIAGRNYGTVRDCRSEFTLTCSFHPSNNGAWLGKDYYAEIHPRIGGIVGRNNGTVAASSSDFTLHANSTASGNDKGHAHTRFYTGGLVGLNEKDCSIEQCFATVNIFSEVKINNNYSSGNSTIGGLVGVNNGIINESYVTGTVVTHTHNTGHIGGFVGSVGASGSIQNCYTRVSITSTSNTYIGGFAGYLTGSIQNCYADADIYATGTSNYSAGFVGGIAAGGIVNKSFTTTDVRTENGTIGFFCANNSNGTGIVQNSYYSAISSVVNNSATPDYSEENGARRDYLSNITSSDFLSNTMYFYSDYWIFTTGSPILRWEIETDGTDLLSGTYYRCSSCGECFVLGTSLNQATIYFDQAATCTTNGIRYFGCSACDKKFAIITEEATGHNYTDDSEGKDFCNNNVKVTYTCTGCKHTYEEQFTATGHRHDHTDGCISCGYVLTPSSCFEAGSLTFICDDCGERIVKTIDAEHTWTFASWYKAPTCTDDGYGNYVCEVCLNNGSIVSKDNVIVENSKLGHLDINGDGICDREECKDVIYSEEGAIEIGTVNDLLNIIKNSSSGSLSKTYILTANIDLSGVSWEPIGTESQPFTGKFIGKGYKISNVPLFSSNTLIAYSGLFGYIGESGVVSGVTIEYAHTADNRFFSQNRSITFGGIAAYNRGTIYGCTVTGTVNVHFLTRAEVNTKGGSASANQSIVFGLIAGENYGFISGCIISANYTYAFENYALMGEDIDNFEPTLITNGSKNMIVSTKQTVAAGTVCGKNHSSISGCILSGNGEVYNYLALSSFADGKYGFLTAVSDLSIGAIAGNASLDGVQDNSVTGTVTYANEAGKYTPASGNDPGNNYYGMSSTTSITIYK